MSRRLLFTAVGVPRFDPGPEEKGAGFKTRGSAGLPLVAVGLLEEVCFGFRAQINARRISSLKKAV